VKQLPAVKSQPKFLFDLYAVIEALTCGNNRIRSSFITGMNSGEVKIIKSVSKELKDCYEDIYNDFQSVKLGRVYQNEGARHYATQQSLMQNFGTNMWGNSPRPACFASVAICVIEKLDLVTNARPLKDCKKIVDKCGLAKPTVLSLTEFADAI
jgi:hypothetical protein